MRSRLRLNTAPHLDSTKVNLFPGFLRAANGTITVYTVEYRTISQSINPSGAITGYYIDVSNVAHGFFRRRCFTSSNLRSRFSKYHMGMAPKMGIVAGGEMRNPAKLVLTATAICLIVPLLAFADPIITNGSFEAVSIGAPFVSSNPADIPGWTHLGSLGDGLLWAVGYVDSNGSVTTAGAGKQFVTLGGGFGAPGTADWSTTITGLTSGHSYVLSFMTATELGTGIEPGGPQTMTVGFLAGSSTSPKSFTSPDSSAAYWRNWVTQDYAFIATAASAVVNFSVNNQQFDMGLDNVSVSAATTPTPEPCSFLLFGSGLLGLAGVIRRSFGTPASPKTPAC